MLGGGLLVLTTQATEERQGVAGFASEVLG
jgi:hypothetical protein